MQFRVSRYRLSVIELQLFSISNQTTQQAGTQQRVFSTCCCIARVTDNVLILFLFLFLFPQQSFGNVLKCTYHVPYHCNEQHN